MCPRYRPAGVAQPRGPVLKNLLAGLLPRALWLAAYFLTMDTPPPPPPPPVPPAPPPLPPAPPPGPAVTEKIAAAFRNVNWQQLAGDFKTFGRRFVTGDFALIKPEPHEAPATAGQPPRMGALMVWRRALLFMACVFTVGLLLKSCFDPHSYRAVSMDNAMQTLEKTSPELTAEQRREQARASVEQEVQTFGESNIPVFDTLLIGTWVTQIASAVLLVLAALRWRELRRSRKLALWGVAIVLVPLLAAMVFPWSALMDFSHLGRQFAGMEGVDAAAVAQQTLLTRLMLQGTMAAMLIAGAVPFFYGLFNGVLRATLAAKTLIPASIVCGWSSLLLALTICVPWFLVLTVVDQFQADALIVIGVVCLLAAPLSLVLKSRRLGASLTPEEATPVVKKARLIFSGLNLTGVLLLVAYASEKGLLNASSLVTGVLQYFANLMLVTVVAVDQLVLLLDRAHRKLAADAAPGEPLRQLGEVIPRA